MIDIGDAVKHLKEIGIESFELSGVLIVPCESAEAIYDMAEKLRKIFKEIGYDKSWSVDPYYYQRHSTLSASMYDDHVT